VCVCVSVCLRACMCNIEYIDIYVGTVGVLLYAYAVSLDAVSGFTCLCCIQTGMDVCPYLYIRMSMYVYKDKLCVFFLALLFLFLPCGKLHCTC